MRNKENKKFDVCIIGAGVAGLALAELISRDNKSVLLIEKGDKVFSEASREHHGWFHLGSLYSIFWKSHFGETLLGNIADLIEYYSHFDGMNLHLTENNKISTKSNSIVPWFSEETINYILAKSNSVDFEVSWLRSGGIQWLKTLFMKLGWRLHVNKFINRHVNFNYQLWTLDNLRSAPSKIMNVSSFNFMNSDISKAISTRLNICTNSHIQIDGFDRLLNTYNIGNCLLTSFKKNGGILKLNEKVISVDQTQDHASVQAYGSSYLAEKVVITAGKDVQDINVNGRHLDSFKRVISPLLVFERAIHKEHFVRMTPYVNKTINHMLHEHEGRKYSVIGGGYSLPHNAGKEDQAKLEADLIQLARKTFRDFNASPNYSVYWGTKTEFTAKSQIRNYQYAIKNVTSRTWCVIPGKFSLGFSAGIETYKHLYGTKPVTAFDLSDSDRPLLFKDQDLIEPKHATLFGNNKWAHDKTNGS